MTTLDSIGRSIEHDDPEDLRVEAARAFLLSMVTPLMDQESVALDAALGRTLAADLVSPLDIPPTDSAAMDGYAFDGAQLQSGGPLTLLAASGTALAGTPWPDTLASGCCVRIMTGAAMPTGADTVVAQEYVHHEGDSIRFDTTRLVPGANCRRRGEDLQAGQVALPRGQALSPAALGLAASLGTPQLPVLRRPRVACFSTGDELIAPGEPRRPGAIYDANRYALCALLRQLGCEVRDLGAVPDQPEALEAAFRGATPDADVILTSGGVSAGDADHTRSIMRKLGDVVFWKLAMRPGRPMAVGRIDRALLFGLPGNPVAAMVSFMVLVRPALLKLMGRDSGPAPLLKVRSAQSLPKKPGRTEYQRGFLSRDPQGQHMVRSTGSQGSANLQSMVQANALIVLQQDQGTVQPGDLVDVMPLPEAGS